VPSITTIESSFQKIVTAAWTVSITFFGNIRYRAHLSTLLGPK
jgi:hypothetical protein